MKILKYALIAVAVLILLFFAMGLFNSSVSYGSKITVDKDVKEAWAVAEDDSKYAQWLEGFQSIELLEGEYGEVGSKYKVVVKPGEDEENFEMIETVVSKKDFDHIEMHFDSDMMDFEQIMLFTETDGKASIETKSKVMGKGLMMRSMFATMETLFGAFTKQEGKNMEALKKLINENTTDYYPAPVVSETEATSLDEASESQ